MMTNSMVVMLPKAVTSPQKDETIVTQSAGRVGRKADGKEYGTVIDYVDSNFGMLAGFSKKRNSVYKKLEYEIM